MYVSQNVSTLVGHDCSANAQKHLTQMSNKFMHRLRCVHMYICHRSTYLAADLYVRKVQFLIKNAQMRELRTRESLKLTMN